MTPPTAALPIAACPNPACRSTKVYVLDEIIAEDGGQFCVICGWAEGGCGYNGPTAETKEDAIHAHNLLCAPAVQATADEAAREIVAGDLFDPEHTGWSMNKSVPVDVVIGRIAAIIRKAVSPKAAAETAGAAAIPAVALDRLVESWLSGISSLPHTDRDIGYQRCASDLDLVIRKQTAMYVRTDALTNLIAFLRGRVPFPLARDEQDPYRYAGRTIREQDVCYLEDTMSGKFIPPAAVSGDKQEKERG